MCVCVWERDEFIIRGQKCCYVCIIAIWGTWTMPRKELDQPCLAARGTIATDITTRSALHRHITHAIKDTTFNLSGMLTPAPSFLPPKNIPPSMPSAVHLTPHCIFLFLCHFPSILFHCNFIGEILDSNLKWDFLKLTKLKSGAKDEDLLEEKRKRGGAEYKEAIVGKIKCHKLIINGLWHGKLWKELC